MDVPFVTPLDSSSLVQLGTCHMMMVFHDNEYADGGAVQTIGDPQDIIVADTKWERTEGLYAWGRSGGNCNKRLGCYGANVRVQFLGNTIVEGNHLWNYNGSYPWGYEPLGPASKTAEPLWLGVPGGGQGPGAPFFGEGSNVNASNGGEQGAINHNIVLRGNKLLSNAGIGIFGNTLNGLIEGNTIVNSSVGINVTAPLVLDGKVVQDNVVRHVLVTNNDVHVDEDMR